MRRSRGRPQGGHALTLDWVGVGGADEHTYMQGVQGIRRYPEAAIGSNHTNIGAVERSAGSKILKMV